MHENRSGDLEGVQGTMNLDCLCHINDGFSRQVTHFRSRAGRLARPKKASEAGPYVPDISDFERAVWAGGRAIQAGGPAG